MKSAIIDWILRLVPAVILAQTLFFKFSAAPESVYIFTQLHMEPWGRIASGVGELIAVILLLIPRYSIYGAILSLGVILGAIASHLLVLGIVVQQDGGTLFILAVVTFIFSLLYLMKHKSETLLLMKKLLRK